MIDTTFLAVITSTISDTAGAPWSKFLVMTICNLVALFVLSRAIWHPHVGPKMPLPFPSLFNNISVPAFFAAMSAGHILGAIALLSLSIDKVI